jgi:hypothetical protein
VIEMIGPALEACRYHFAGNAEGSTLRLTLGCLLTDHLGKSVLGQVVDTLSPTPARSS